MIESICCVKSTLASIKLFISHFASLIHRVISFSIKLLMYALETCHDVALLRVKLPKTHIRNITKNRSEQDVKDNTRGLFLRCLTRACIFKRKLDTISATKIDKSWFLLRQWLTHFLSSAAKFADDLPDRESSSSTSGNAEIKI